jgi:hypothetical protein
MQISNLLYYQASLRALFTQSARHILISPMFWLGSKGGMCRDCIMSARWNPYK